MVGSKDAQLPVKSQPCATPPSAGERQRPLGIGDAQFGDLRQQIIGKDLFSLETQN